jgi:hypothetical protein
MGATAYFKRVPLISTNNGALLEKLFAIFTSVINFYASGRRSGDVPISLAPS